MPHNSSSVSCLYALLSYLHLLYIPSFKYIYPPLNRLKDREAVDQAKQLVTTLQSEHTVAMKTLQTTTENEINSLKKGHDNEMLSLKQAHEEALRTLVQSHEQSIASLKDNHDKSLASLTRGTMTQIPCPSPLYHPRRIYPHLVYHFCALPDHTAQIQGLRKEHEDASRQLQQSHDKACVELKVG